MDEGLAVIVAAILAILGIFYASRQQRKMLRKQHTFQVIEKLNASKELDGHVEFAARLVQSGKVPRLCDEVHQDSCERIDFMLNYYEFLACAIICGDIDEELVKRMERSRLCRSYLLFIPYVEENREERGEGLWENLEFICYRWTVHPDAYNRLIERFLLRPAIASYYSQRAEISAYLKKEGSAQFGFMPPAASSQPSGG
jgi:hypothetical protein